MTEKRIRRWFDVSPEKAFVGTLVGELLVFSLFWFVVQDVGVGVSLVLVLFVGGLTWVVVKVFVNRIVRQRFRFSLRTLLALAVLLALPLGWVAVRLEQGRKQRKVAAEIAEMLGGAVYYTDGHFILQRERRSSGPEWLGNLFLDDAYARVHSAQLTGIRVADDDLANLTRLKSLDQLFLNETRVTDAGLVHLGGLTNLRYLDLTNTKVSDSGLVHLQGLHNLTWLKLDGTRVTYRGVRKLRQSLPHCEIGY